MPCAGYYGIIISESFGVTPLLSFNLHIVPLISLIFVCQLDLTYACLKQVWNCVCVCVCVCVFSADCIYLNVKIRFCLSAKNAN
jgi:hypothetical protein